MSDRNLNHIKWVSMALWGFCLVILVLHILRSFVGWLILPFDTGSLAGLYAFGNDYTSQAVGRWTAFFCAYSRDDLGRVYALRGRAAIRSISDRRAILRRDSALRSLVRLGGGGLNDCRHADQSILRSFGAGYWKERQSPLCAVEVRFELFVFRLRLCGVRLGAGGSQAAR